MKNLEETLEQLLKKKIYIMGEYNKYNIIENYTNILSGYLPKKENKYFINNLYEKNIEIKEYNYNIINKNFSKILRSPLGVNFNVRDSVSITADNIGEFALPIVEYIHQTKPDYVIASDRGARLLGLAVFKLYRELYGRFPTADGTLRFRRFSKSNSQKATIKHVKPLVKEMLQYRERPNVLVLDDWVASGGTKRLAKDAFDSLGGRNLAGKRRIKVKFGVLVGGGADVTGHGNYSAGFGGITDWRDDSNIIGVRYGNDDFGNHGTKAEPVRSKEAMEYRRRMYEGIDKLVSNMTDKKRAVS